MIRDPRCTYLVDTCDCQAFPTHVSMECPVHNDKPMPKDTCPVHGTSPTLFFHVTPKPDACKHDFQGWREFPDGRGGERVCTKCGMGAMAHTLSLDF